MTNVSGATIRNSTITGSETGANTSEGVVVGDATSNITISNNTISAIAQDLLVNVGRSTGSCTLRYTGVALASQGTGTDVHVITFTVQAQ